MGALPIHLFGHICCRMYHLATMQFVTDRQTDNIIMTLATIGYKLTRKLHGNSTFHLWNLICQKY